MGHLNRQSIPETLKKCLMKLSLSNNLAHLFIFASPCAQTASSVAKDFALDWLGSVSVTHPDLLLVKTTGKIGMHSVAGIRCVLDQLSLTPHGAKGRAVLIIDADKMLPSTANALLKALEEPPSRTLIILSTVSPHRILPTILSRAQIIRIPSTVLAETDIVQPLLDCLSSANFAYTTLQEICNNIQTKIEKELSDFAKKDLSAISKEYADLEPSAKQEFQQEIESSSVHAMQSRSKEILEAVYLNSRGLIQDDAATRLLLEAMRGIDAGAELSHMLSWFASSLSANSTALA
jgi:DNA polymerase III delta prime subunit